MGPDWEAQIPPCALCALGTDLCVCPPCPECQEVGNPSCALNRQASP